MADVRQHITSQLEAYQDLESLKAAVRQWVNASDGSLDALEKALEAHQEEDAGWEVGEVDESFAFTPLTEQDRIKQSLAAVEEYRRTGEGASQAQVADMACRLLNGQ